MEGEESPRHQSVRALHMEGVAASEELPVSIPTERQLFSKLAKRVWSYLSVSPER